MKHLAFGLLLLWPTTFVASAQTVSEAELNATFQIAAGESGVFELETGRISRTTSSPTPQLSIEDRQRINQRRTAARLALRELGSLASPSAIGALLRVLASRRHDALWPDAAMALARAAAQAPRARPRALRRLRRLLTHRPDVQAHVNLVAGASLLEGCGASGGGGIMGEQRWFAPDAAAALVVLGDPSDAIRIARARTDRAIAGAGHFEVRLHLLANEMHLASRARAPLIVGALDEMKREIMSLPPSTECGEQNRQRHLRDIESLRMALNERRP